MRIYLLFVICLANVLFAWGNKTTDSCLTVIAAPETTDEERISTYYQLTSIYYYLNKDSSIYYNQQGLDLARQINSLHGICRGRTNEAMQLINSASFDKAMDILDEVIELLDQDENLEIRVFAESNRGIIHHHKSNYDEAITHYQLAADACRKMKDQSELPRIYFNIGNVLAQLESFERALPYYRKAVKTSKENGKLIFEMASLTDLGYIHQQLGNTDSAKYYMQKAYQLSDQTESPQILYRVNFNLGSFYNEQNLHDSAYHHLLIAYENVKAFSEIDVATVCCMLGKTQNQRGNKTEAVNFFREFESLVEGQDFQYINQVCYKWWAEVEHANGNFKRSLELFTLYDTARDSAFTIEKDKAVSELETKYETEQKEFEIARQEAELKRQTTTNFLLIGLLALALGLLLATALYFRQRINLKQARIDRIQKEQELNAIQAMLEGEEKERVRIARELHDGMGGNLAAIKMRLSSLMAEYPELEQSEKYASIIENVQDSGDDVRRISHNLMPEVLLKFGLIKALEDYINRINSTGILNASLQHFGLAEKLNERIELSIYRIIQELMNNIIKHAGATRALVQLNRSGETLSITIEDDGIGFNEAVEEDGIGLDNLKARVEALHGDLNIDSEQGVGTSVYIELNLKK